MRFKSERKGVSIALESLLGIILSVIALILLFQLFANIFLQTPTNLKIAEDNAKSIVEFVDYSENKYKNMNECFSILKLKNLDNYQIETQGQLYFHIINHKGVYIFEKEILTHILSKDIELNDDFLEKYSVAKYYFKNEKKIMKENLDPNQIGFDFVNEVAGIFDVASIFEEDDDIQIEKDFFYRSNLVDSNYIILAPVFGQGILGYDLSFGDDYDFIKFFGSNQNTMTALNYERFIEDDILNMFSNKVINEFYYDSSYLVYKVGSNLYPSYTSEGEFFIKNNLCEFDNFLLERSKDKFGNTEGYIDEINFYDSYFINQYVVIFKEEGAVCLDSGEEINCKDKFNTDFDGVNPEKFESEYGIGKLENLLGEEIDEVQKVLFPKTDRDYFYKIFEPINLDKKITIEDFESGLGDITELSLIEDFSSRYPNYRAYELEGYNMNECSSQLCDYLIYNINNGNVYFYDDVFFKDFVGFDVSYMFKEKLEDSNPDRSLTGVETEIERYKEIYKLYFGSSLDNKLNEVNFDIVQFDKNFAWYGDRYFIIIEIPYLSTHDTYKIAISKEQWDKISARLEE